MLHSVSKSIMQLPDLMDMRGHDTSGMMISSVTSPKRVLEPCTLYLASSVLNCPAIFVSWGKRSLILLLFDCKYQPWTKPRTSAQEPTLSTLDSAFLFWQHLFTMTVSDMEFGDATDLRSRENHRMLLTYLQSLRMRWYWHGLVNGSSFVWVWTYFKFLWILILCALSI